MFVARCRFAVRLAVVFCAIRCAAADAEQAVPAGSADGSAASMEILTPRPGPEPRINGPRLFGVRPARPLIYRIPCTGQRPIAFAVDGLPQGLQVDPAAGIITGRVPDERGDYAVTLRATNAHGAAEKRFTIVVGDTLALTPPMGWNSWYIHLHDVTEQHMRNAADAMVRSGMADVGYTYVNIDDCWMKKQGDEPYRDAGGTILPNAKFPDIPGMVDHIHAHGLRAGLYTSPGPWTCARYAGAYGHEADDAKQFADWGFDFLKYDWCSYGRAVQGDRNDRDYASKPYRLMGDLLKQQNRDILLNLCQYGMCRVWEWGGEIGGHCWRTTGDLGLDRGGRLPGFYNIAFKNMEHWQHAKPGCWNDPDYILIGWITLAGGKSQRRPTELTADEQYSYMSMWCLMAAPLIFSGDMEKLDPFTINVLCNPEVIAVDQDALGKQAKPLRHTDEQLVLAKPMEDGSSAVGLFNLGDQAQEISVGWSELGIEGTRQARDLWRQKDLGAFDGSFSATVPRHGVILVRLAP